MKTLLHRGIEGSHSYLWPDAFHKIRESGRVVSVATVVAVCVSEAVIAAC
jgi:transposase-like protein